MCIGFAGQLLMPAFLNLADDVGAILPRVVERHAGLSLESAHCRREKNCSQVAGAIGMYDIQCIVPYAITRVCSKLYCPSVGDVSLILPGLIAIGMMLL